MMRGSFGGGRGMGGGAAGGGSMLRAVGRVVTRTGVTGSGGGGGLQEPFSASSANSAPTSPRNSSHNKVVVSKNQLLSLSSSSSSPFSPLAAPLSSGASPWPPSQYDDDDDYFWVPPSQDEVQNAVSAIQQVFFDSAATYPQFIRDRFGPNLDNTDVCPPPPGNGNGMMHHHHVASKGSDLDWMEPTAAFHLCSSSATSLPAQPYHGYGSERVLDAFHLLRTDSCVQRMVVSLSQDRAVWDAMMNNEVVREEFRASCYGGEEVDVAAALPNETSEEEDSISSNEAIAKAPPVPVVLVDIMRQMFGHTKSKFMDMVEKITNLLVNHLFKSQTSSSAYDATGEAAAAGTRGDPFEAKLRASFMLSVVVLLIVVTSRGARGAAA